MALPPHCGAWLSVTPGSGNGSASRPCPPQAQRCPPSSLPGEKRSGDEQRGGRRKIRLLSSQVGELRPPATSGGVSRPSLPVVVTAPHPATAGLTRGLGRAAVSARPLGHLPCGPHTAWPRCHSDFQVSVVPGPACTALSLCPRRPANLWLDSGVTFCFAFLGEHFASGTMGSTDLWAPSTEGSACPAGWCGVESAARLARLGSAGWARGTRHPRACPMVRGSAFPASDDGS